MSKKYQTEIDFYNVNTILYVCRNEIVWKVQDFSVTRILREIDVGEFGTQKVNFVDILNFDCCLSIR